MTVREMIEKYGITGDMTFIITVARKDDATPFYHAEYKTTPIRYVDDWKVSTQIMESIVLNDRQMPIDWLSGAMWAIQVENGNLESWLIISKKDFEMLYHGDQRAMMEKYIDEMIAERRKQ